ncbi:mechanosensitive ion channel family protein [Candidatus Micrarchaeota archaeon]|nr:mechanosensitive ion channel family protein [Candidatus Micrarchaeota archaeon]
MISGVPASVLVVLELAFSIAVSWVLGKILFIIFLRIAKSFTERTKTTLDDRIIASCEGPLELSVIVFLTYLSSSYLTHLFEVSDWIARYSLAVGILLVSFLLSNIMGAFLRWYYEEGARKYPRGIDTSFLPLLRKILKVTILFFGVLIAMGTLGLDISGLLTMTGVIVLVLGLASQETLANFFAGLALQLDRHVRYGDYLRFVNGDVVQLKRIGFRSSEFVDSDGRQVVMSNSEFAKQRITVVGVKGRPAAVSVTVELPRRFRPEQFSQFLERQLARRKPEWLAGSSVSFSVERVGESVSAISFVLQTSDFSNANSAKTFVEAAALLFVQSRNR